MRRGGGERKEKKRDRTTRRIKTAFDGRAVSAQRFRGTDPMLSAGATGPAALRRGSCVLCRLACWWWWWMLRCCAPSSRGGKEKESWPILSSVGSPAGGKCDGGRGLESRSRKDFVMHAVWTRRGYSCFSLCVCACVLVLFAFFFFWVCVCDRRLATVLSSDVLIWHSRADCVPLA